jgi:hypothetical protein
MYSINLSGIITMNPSMYSKHILIKNVFERKKELPYDPTIPLMGIYLKECKSGYNKGTCTPMCTAALFTIAKLRKQPK